MSKNKPALSAEQIQSLLDRILDVEFSFIKTQEPANVLAQLQAEKQAYMLQWVQRVASTNIQLAYQFINHAIAALEQMDKSTVETWALHAIDTYDNKGLHSALAVIHNVNDFVELNRAKSVGITFEEKSPVLLHFANGLSGRKLALKQADYSYTDTETLFLPALYSVFDDKESNFLLYKASVSMLWAQTRFGTFRLDVVQKLLSHAQKQHLIPLFHCMETLRLEYFIQRELPGLYRDMQNIKNTLGYSELPRQWNSIQTALQHSECSSTNSLELSRKHLLKLQPYPLPPYQGALELEIAGSCIEARINKEKAQLRTALYKLEKDLGRENKTDTNKFAAHPPKNQDKDKPYDLNMEITLDDQPINPPDNINKLLSSIKQDLGEIPDEYLHAAGPGEYDPSLFEEQEQDPNDVWKGTYHEKGAFLYNEWDFRRQHYRKNWCAVRELDIKPKYDQFARETLSKYSGLIKHLRKTFEALRDENRNLKRQSDGENIDLDSLVEALADTQDGREMPERLFTRMHRVERNIAVCFMVDMSGSTKGWINQAERESLILLCETLETLGDRYAIYGFSGIARKRCEVYKIKQFGEIYNEEIKARISAIEPKDYTRMGFAIRHLGQILNDIEARTRILITLSDGKPDDYDNYRGEYGIEDTRRALVEIRRNGIHPYCITIDKEAKDYLPHMYGPAAYTVIDEVRKLPLKVSDIYRRLTT